jgi:tetratricopeptide (TPR) repeat protein
VLPFDGGHVADALAEAWTGEPRHRAVGALGVVVGSAGLCWAVLNHQLWIGYLAAIGVMRSGEQWSAGAGPRRVEDLRAEIAAGRTAEARERIARALPRVRREADRGALLEALALSWLRDGDAPAARQAIDGAAGWTPSGSIRAHLAVAEARPEEAVALLAPEAARGGLRPGDGGVLTEALIALGRAGEVPALHERAGQVGWRAAEILAREGGATLYRAGRFEEALALCARAATESPGYAYLAARCCARLGRADEALAWVRRAVERGFPAASALGDPDLALLRGRPELAALAGRREA